MRSSRAPQIPYLWLLKLAVAQIIFFLFESSWMPGCFDSLPEILLLQNLFCGYQMMMIVSFTFMLSDRSNRQQRVVSAQFCNTQRVLLFPENFCLSETFGVVYQILRLQIWPPLKFVKIKQSNNTFEQLSFLVCFANRGISFMAITHLQPQLSLLNQYWILCHGNNRRKQKICFQLAILQIIS